MIISKYGHFDRKYYFIITSNLDIQSIWIERKMYCSPPFLVIIRKSLHKKQKSIKYTTNSLNLNEYDTDIWPINSAEQSFIIQQ